MTETDPTAPVVAAVVTSNLGVLMTWRRDQSPPVGFVTGEIRPGEAPADALVRKCQQEARLAVTPGEEIGRRVHPRTEREMIYVAGTAAESTELFVDDAELTDVRWISLADAEREMAPFGGMYPPVQEYVRRALGTS